MAVKKTRSIGLKMAYFGDVNPDGGMPQEMRQLGKTVKGSASFNTNQDTVQDFYSEEEPDAPEESVTTEGGLKEAELSIMEWDNESLIELFGGTTKTATVTVDGETYEVEKYVAPRQSVTIEKALRMISLYKVGIDIPRAKITAQFVWNFTRTEIAQIKVSARALAPVSQADGPYEIYALGEKKIEP